MRHDLDDQAATDLVRDTQIEISYRDARGRNRHLDGRAEKVITVDGAQILVAWSYDEQQRRKAPCGSIESITETQTGEIFDTYDAWLADLIANPHYKPNPALIHRWYMVRDASIVMMFFVCTNGGLSEQIRTIIADYIKQRMSAKCTQEEASECTEYCFHHWPNSEDAIEAWGRLTSGTSKKQMEAFDSALCGIAEALRQPPQAFRSEIERIFEARQDELRAYYAS